MESPPQPLRLLEAILYPVLFHLGSFVVTGYAALVAVGLVGGGVIFWLAGRRRGLNPVQVLDVSLAGALGGLIGGRAVYVAAHGAYYGDHMWQVLRLWSGGLAWHGALVGGLLVASVYCAVRRIPLGLMLDALAPGAAFLAACGWLGCLLNGCAYGIETYPGQGLVWTLSLELPDLYGIWVPRVAVQLLGAAWGGIVLAVVVFARRRARMEGLIFPLWLAVYTLGSFGLGFLRADEPPLISGWRADQIVDLALSLVGVFILAGGLFRSGKEESATLPEA
jgi:phosphatidylglycerol:prolipoprotein diacylglycerol transferase